MNLRRIKHTLLRMTAEEKVIGIGSLFMITGTFMPWYNVVMSFDKKTLTETGFSGDLGVIGFIIFIMSLVALLVLVAENMRLPIPRFGYKREQILFFLLGQGAFLTLLTMAIYTKRSLEFTDAGLRFGIYLVLAGAFFGALSAFTLIQKTGKKEVVDFFRHENDDSVSDDQDNGSKVIKNNRRTENNYETDPVQENSDPESMAFNEDAELIAKETASEGFSDYIPEDDTIENIKEVSSEENNVEHTDSSDKKGKDGSMNFYEDR